MYYSFCPSVFKTPVVLAQTLRTATCLNSPNYTKGESVCLLRVFGDLTRFFFLKHNLWKSFSQSDSPQLYSYSNDNTGNWLMSYMDGERQTERKVFTVSSDGEQLSKHLHMQCQESVSGFLL